MSGKRRNARSRNLAGGDEVRLLRYPLLRYAAAVVPAILLLSAAGCLLMYPAPEFGPLPDAGISVDELYELDLAPYALTSGKPITFAYEIDQEGWIAIPGTVLAHTFNHPGEYSVTVYASNGLRQSEAAFTLTVTE